MYLDVVNLCFCATPKPLLIISGSTCLANLSVGCPGTDALAVRVEVDVVYLIAEPVCAVVAAWDIQACAVYGRGRGGKRWASCPVSCISTYP